MVVLIDYVKSAVINGEITCILIIVSIAFITVILQMTVVISKKIVYVLVNLLII